MQTCHVLQQLTGPNTAPGARALRHETSGGGGLGAARGVAEDVDTPGVGGDERGAAAHHRRLARTIGAQHSGDGAGGGGQTQPVEGLDTTKGDPHVVENQSFSRSVRVTTRGQRGSWHDDQCRTLPSVTARCQPPWRRRRTRRCRRLSQSACRRRSGRRRSRR